MTLQEEINGLLPHYSSSGVYNTRDPATICNAYADKHRPAVLAAIQSREDANVELRAEIARLREALDRISSFSVQPGPGKRFIPTPEAKIARAALIPNHAAQTDAS